MNKIPAKDSEALESWKSELLEKVANCEIVCRLESTLSLEDDVYTKCYSLVIGTVHGSETAVPLISIGVTHTMDTANCTAIKAIDYSIDLQTAASSLIEDQITRYNRANRTAEDEVIEDISDVIDTPVEEEPEVEDVYEYALGKGLTITNSTGISTSGEFVSAEMNGYTVYGTKTELDDVGLTVTNEASTVGTDNIRQYTSTVKSVIPATTEDKVSTLTHMYWEYPDDNGYVTYYGDATAVTSQFTTPTIEEFPSGILGANLSELYVDGSWSYRVYLDTTNSHYHLYAVKFDSPNVFETLNLDAPHEEKLVDFLTFVLGDDMTYGTTEVPAEEEATVSPSPSVTASVSPSVSPATSASPSPSATATATTGTTTTGTSTTGTTTTTTTTATASPSPSVTATATPTTPVATTIVSTTFNGKTVWAINEAVTNGTAYGTTSTTDLYSDTSYYSNGTVGTATCSMTDQIMTYSSYDSLLETWGTRDAILEEYIGWPLSIYTADATDVTISENITDGSYIYRTATYNVGGTTKYMLIAVKISSTAIEVVTLQSNSESALTAFIQLI